MIGPTVTHTIANFIVSEGSDAVILPVICAILAAIAALLINPHFLYNTLSMINWTAAKYDCDEVEQQILLLSSYYKGCLSSGETLVSIEDEVKTVSLYIQLHSIRSGLDIAFQSDIEEVKHYKIPKLTLQPLIENSIMHGIMQKPTQSGTIQVIGEIDEDTILLKILDDGVGFVQKDIDNASNSKSYGMKNVSTRLKLYFGEDCGVFCNPTARQQGAVVTVKLKKEPLSFLEICRE